MRNTLNLIVLFFFFITISCKENQPFNREHNTSKKITLDSLNFSKEAEFKQIILKCNGEEYNAKECINEKEKFSMSFSQNSINFSINNRDFKDNHVSDLGELGYQPYLFGDINNKLIILDSFLENGHLLYFYFYDKAGLKFLEKKEIIISEEITLFEKIKVSQTKNELIIAVGNGIEDLRFNIDKGINLNAGSNISVNEIMEQSKANPEEITDHIIFTKDQSNKLQINTEILKYIQQNTNAQKNQYTIALEKYVTHEIIKFYDDGERKWTEEQLIKIIAFASNTTDPLHKKFWKESPENWHNGMWGNILSFCYLVYPKTLWLKLQNQLKKENYYNLPNAKEMISYALEFDKFGPP